MSSDSHRAIEEEVSLKCRHRVPRHTCEFCRDDPLPKTRRRISADTIGSLPPATELGGEPREPVIIPHATVTRKLAEERMAEKKRKELSKIDLYPLWEKIAKALVDVDSFKDVYVRFTKEEPRLDEVINRLKQAGYDASRDGRQIRIRFFQATDPDDGEYELGNIHINEDGERQ